MNKRILSAANRFKYPELDCFVLIENKNHQVVGFAVLGPCREKPVPADGEVHAIYILAEYQNKGGGRLLLDKCFAQARSRSYAKIMVSVLEQNDSRKFYEATGASYWSADHVDIEHHRYPTSTYIWNLFGEV